LRRFKLPLIVTGIAFVLMVAIAVGGMIFIAQSGASNREKEARAQALGSGSAMLLCIIVAPFWLFEAAKIGKERRAAQQKPVRAAARSVQQSTASLPPRRR
jgi:Na+-driven multidrug efflux pump